MPYGGLTTRLIVTGEEMAGNRGGTMNHNVLAPIGRHVAAFVSEGNYAQTRVASVRHTPARFCRGTMGARSRAGFPARIQSPLPQEPAVSRPGPCPAS